MSVRGLWVIKPVPADESNPSRPRGVVLFSRRFPTVEQRSKRSCEQCPSLYSPIPLDSELCDEIMLRCSTANEEFIEERDSVSNDIHWPVYGCGSLWPIVCLQEKELLYVAIPSFDPIDNKRPPLIKLPSIPAAVSLLEGMMEVLSTATKLETTSPQLVELFQYLCLAAPFGTPSETNPTNLKLQLQFRKAVTMPKEKVPSWRPAVYKGSSKLYLKIKEEIRAVQYDRPDMEDVWQLYGSISCKAELEGHPDILITLTTPSGSSHLDHLIVHSCVQTADAEPLPVNSPERSDSAHSRNIRFSAPLETFTLCHYQLTAALIPIRGFYQMKGDTKVELLIQLKLHESVRNNFDFCEVQIPFFNRGTIEKMENITPTSANVCLSPDSKSLVWNIGQKFNPKTLEVSLGVTLTFVEFPPEEEEKSIESRFCVEQNSYCELNFKLSDYTLTGAHIDSRSITLFPSVKYKLTLAREFVSSGYRIWNSHGDTLGIPSVDEIITEQVPNLPQTVPS